MKNYLRDNKFLAWVPAVFADLLLFAEQVGAQGGASAACNTSYAFGCTLSSYVANFAKWGIGAGISLAVVMVIYAGYTMTISSGDPSKVGFAKEVIVAALTGIVFLAGAQLILNLLRVAGS